MKGFQIGTDKEATFETDLKEAHILENRLGEMFSLKHDCTAETSQSKGSFSDYDVKVFLKNHK